MSVPFMYDQADAGGGGYIAPDSSAPTFIPTESSRSTRKVEYATFTCRFDNDTLGVKKELLDYVNEIVIPAFFNDSNIREVRGGTYYLLNVDLVQVDRDPDPVIGIVGRFVKDTKFTIEQRIETQTNEETQEEERVVVPDGQKVERALSSVFLLILNDHSLVYLHETQDAPGVEAFGNTMQVFFNRQRAVMLRRLQVENREAKKEGKEGVPADQIPEQNPAAKVHVTPMFGIKTIEKAVEDFQLVQVVSFVSHRNNGSTMGGAPKNFAALYREAQDGVEATTAVSSFYNPEGLEKAEVQELVTEVAADPDTDIRLAGIDHDGGRITRSKEEIKVREDYPLDTAQNDNLAPTGGHFWDHFKRALARGLFTKRSQAKNPDEVRQKIGEVTARHGNEIRRVGLN